MKRLKKLYWLGVLGSIVMLGCLTWAQPAPFVLETFDLTQLDARPGRIVVSPDVLTLLEFDNQIADVSTARPDAMTIEVNQNVIRLRSNWTAGNTDLVVTIGNRTAMFMVSVDPEGEHTRRYVVEVPEPPRPLFGRSDSSPSLRSPVPIKRLEDLGISLPEWIVVSFNKVDISEDEVVIQYGLKNDGDNILANDGLRLKLLQQDRPVPYTLERMTTGGTLNRLLPGFSEYGTILVENPIEGDLTLVWELVEIGAGTVHTLKQVFENEATSAD